MKFSPSIFAIPTTLVAVLLLANCSSDAPAPTNTGGSSNAGAGSGGKSASAGAAPVADGPAFAMVRTMIVSSCLGGNGCHAQEGNPMILANDSSLYGTLIGHTTAHCGKVINTGVPADSALVKLLQADCGGTLRMPYQKCWQGDMPADNEACIPTATVSAIQAWIAAGAPN